VEQRGQQHHDDRQAIEHLRQYLCGILRIVTDALGSSFMWIIRRERSRRLGIKFMKNLVIATGCNLNWILPWDGEGTAERKLLNNRKKLDVLRWLSRYCLYGRQRRLEPG
jgi:hypothetical protein